MYTQMMRAISVSVIALFAALACNFPTITDRVIDRAVTRSSVPVEENLATTEATPYRQYSPTTAANPTVPLPPSTYTPAPLVMPEFVNPGFEEGFYGWSDDLRYSIAGMLPQSAQETREVHSGTQARMLWLRLDRSTVIQRVLVDLPTGTTITASAWFKTQGSKADTRDNCAWIILSVSAGYANVQVGSAYVDSAGPLPNWTQLTTRPLVLVAPVTWLEVQAQTGFGYNSDHDDPSFPVYVDDFRLVALRP